MKRIGPKIRATRGKKPAAERDLLVANVILRPVSGKSLTGANPLVTPRTVREYLPDSGALEQARRLLTELGFQIDLVAPTHIAIAGRKELFERTFRVRLVKKFAPYFQSSKTKKPAPATQPYYVASVSPTIPANLAKVVELLEFPGPVTHFVSPTPPPLPYYHLEVPDGVAGGMDALKAHDLGFTGKGIKLAMIDTGFMTPFHPYYLSENYNIQPLVPEIAGYPEDDSVGHGTAIAACALAVAPEVTLTPYQWSQGGNPATAFANAIGDGPDIITCSWGTTWGWALAFQIQLAVTKGIVVCFACGNEGVLGWPGSDPAVISVGGAYLHSDGSIEASNYASSGINPVNPGRQVPDLCGLCGMAPHGSYIALPTQPASQKDWECACDTDIDKTWLCPLILDGTAVDDGWLVASGTSSATPMVAATAALIMQGNNNIIGDPEAVRQALIQSCKDVTTGVSANGQAAGPGTDQATGAGLVQAYEAVKDYPVPIETLSWVSIDLLAVLLGNEVYATLKKPNPPPISSVRGRIREVVRAMSPKEKKQAIANLKVVDDYVKAVKQALSVSEDK